MAKRRSSGGDELNLDSLMDAVTNVVGVLMIVFVMVSLQVARTVSKILSDLPPVTPEQLAKIQEELKTLPVPEKPPEKIDEEKKLAEQELKKVNEEFKTIDITDVQQKLKFMDLDEIRKQIELKRLDRDKQKTEMDKMLTEIERLKAMLDQTPVYEPPPPTYVRLPNPRPYPEKPNETRVLVAKAGVILYREADYLDPVKAGLESVKSQLEYKDIKIDPFAKMLEAILGSKAEAAKAWPEIAPLAGTFQLDQVAHAYKNLIAGGIQPDKALLDRVGNVALVVRQTLPDVAAAIAAAAKGDVSKWVAMNPSKDPANPTIKVATAGNKRMFFWGSKGEEVKPTPRDIANYFKDLGSQDAFKNAGKARIIYDAFRVAEMLKKAASSQIFTKSYVMTPTIKPGATLVQIAMTPRAGGGESVDQIKQPNSGFVSAMRAIKNDPNGVALFQVMPDAFNTYLDARRIADEVGVPATWEFLKGLDLVANVTGFEVQRFSDGTAAKGTGKAPVGVTIAPPKRTLD